MTKIANKGIFYAAECRDANISLENSMKTLEINLSSVAPFANHVVPALKGKEGITLISELFGNKRDIKWGERRQREIEEHEQKGEKYFVTIANTNHLVRWTSGRGLVIIDGYALLNIRSSYAETDPEKLTDMGGYGEKRDLYDPGYCAHREIAEEVAILTLDKKLLVPKFPTFHDRKIDFEEIITKVCKDTGLEFQGIQEAKGWERKDLAEDYRIIIRKNGKLRLDEKLQFLYDPRSNCGIDVITTLEYETGLDPRKELVVGFAEYYPILGGFKVLGKNNDMVFVDIYQLLEEFDKETLAKTLDAHLRNAYTGVSKETKINPTNINGSLRQQLRTMKERNYQFGKR
jgi:hypothetical protein